LAISLNLIWSNIVEDDKSSVKWTVSPDVRATSTEDGSVLLDINKGLCYSLNVVAARIWLTIETCPAGISLEGIVGALETHFKISHEELKADTVECLEKLQRLRLVQSNGHSKSSKAFGEGS